MITNQVLCANDIKNTGTGACAFDPKLIAGAAFSLTNFEIAGADVATKKSFLAALKELAAADSKLTRLFVMPGVETPTDNTEDPSFQTFESKRQVLTAEGDVIWDLQFIDGGLCASNAMRSFNGKKVYAIFWDDQFQVLGTKNSDGNFSAIPQKMIYTSPWKGASSSAVALYTTKFVMEPGYINENLAFAVLDGGLQDLQGLQDVLLVPQSTTITSGVTQVTIQTLCGGANLGDVYATELANIARFIAANAATGGIITISSVAYSAITKRFTITLSTVDADYPSSGGQVQLQLVAPSALTTAGIEGYEGTPILLTVA